MAGHGLGWAGTLVPGSRRFFGRVFRAEELPLCPTSIALRVTWVSSYHSDFNYDFSFSFLPE
jgi:hypothetical protein